MRHLRFNRLPAELLEIVLSDIGSALMDAPVALGSFEASEFQGEHRTRRLEADGVEVTEVGTRKWEPGRDGGWGYSLKWTLAAQAPCGQVKLSFSGAGWEPIPNDLGLSTNGVDPQTFRRIRARLRARLGDDADQTDMLWPALDNIETALKAGHLDLARELFDAAWSRPGVSGEGGFARLEALRPRLESPC